MEKFDDLLTELNFYDYSVGIKPIETIVEVVELLEEFDFSPFEVVENYILLLDDVQQYKLYFDGEWIIKK